MGSLIQQNSALSLVERMKAIRNRAALLLDVSSSMDLPLEREHKRIDALRAIVHDLEGPMDVIAFNTAATKVSKDSIPNPSGGTYLSKALILAKQNGHRKVVVVTDGEVNGVDQEASLREAEGMEIKILYVGPDGKEPAFLKKLAEKTGGFCSKEDLKLPKELGAKLTLLLGPAPGDRKIEL